mgnify:CR=1 FL=1
MNFIERNIKKTLRKFGILIRYYSPSSSEEERRFRLIIHHNIDLVFDAGANTGQFALSLIDSGYKNKIVSFEPLSAAYKTLVKESKKYSNWEVTPRCALGNDNREMEINISKNSVSSTLLDMLDTHLQGAPESEIIGKEKASMFKLDYIGKEYINSNNVYLKIDAQGYEYEVLLGSQEVFPNIKGIELEMSLEPLYRDQDWLFPNVLDYMKKNEFVLHSISPAFVDFNTGKVLQYNGIFFRRH